MLRIMTILLAGLCWIPAPPVAPVPPEPSRLTKDGDFKQHLCWSPDGKQMLFTRLHKGRMGVWLMQADGSNPRPLLQDETPHFDGCWAPDNKTIAFVYDVLQGTDGKLQINAIQSDGSGNKVL